MCYVKNHSLARKHGYMTRKQGLLYLSQKHYNFVIGGLDSCDYYVESMFISRFYIILPHTFPYYTYTNYTPECIYIYM